MPRAEGPGLAVGQPPRVSRLTVWCSLAFQVPLRIRTWLQGPGKPSSPPGASKVRVAGLTEAWGCRSHVSVFRVFKQFLQGQ